MKGLKEMDAVAAAAALSELARLPGAQRCHREAAEPAPDGSGPAAREDPGDAATEPMPSNGDVCMEVVTDSPLPLAGVARPDGHGWGDSPLGSEGGGAFPAEFAFYGSRTKSAISGSGGDSPSASASPMLLPSKSRSRAPAHVPRQPKGSGGCEATLKALESDEGVGDQEAPVIPNEDRAKGKTPQSAPQATKPSRSSGQQQTGAGVLPSLVHHAKGAKTRVAFSVSAPVAQQVV